MNGIIKSSRHVIFLILIAILVLPYLQNQFRFIQIPPLKGDVVITRDTVFSVDDWFSGEYQKRKELHLNDSFGFRSFFVRLNNQIDYNFFNKANARGVIIGENNCLFEESYISAFYGEDFVGEDSLVNQMTKLKMVSDTLARLNKSLIIVFAPGKTFYFSEYVPQKSVNSEIKTNIETRIRLANELKLNYIDFHNYFIANKNKSPYPLYPINGIHWSYFGACIVTDSLIHYIEDLRHIDMPNIYWDTIILNKAKKGDSDIADGLNLLFGYNPETMAYPVISLEPDSGKSKPSMMIISDSFYWMLDEIGFSKVFSKVHFWYYNSQIYPESFKTPYYTSDVNFEDEINKHDIIILMGSTPAMANLGWGFVDKAYNYFRGNKELNNWSPEFRRKLNEIENYIRTDKEWLEKIKIKALRKNISVDSMITVDAVWLIQNQ
jgi:hypothetical protein